jgi:hypothetical protein
VDIRRAGLVERMNEFRAGLKDMGRRSMFDEHGMGRGGKRWMIRKGEERTRGEEV